jgi:hypothetical protein
MDTNEGLEIPLVRGQIHFGSFCAIEAPNP